MCRRIFTFAFAFLFAYFTGCVDWSALEKTYAERDVREKVGILAHLDIGWESSTTPFRRALAHFQKEGVDKVIILGDPTKDGFANQRKVFDEAWKKAFAGTPPPERILVPEGEYEFEGITWTSGGRFPLTDLLCIHPKNGRRIDVGSMRGFAVSDVFVKQDAAILARIRESAQGLLVLVRDEGLEIRRLDFSAQATEVGPPWTVDREKTIHSEADDVPRFWDDAIVAVTPGYDGKGRPQYIVRWAPVRAKHTGARAFSYDVHVGKRVIRRVQSDGFFLPESRDSAAIRCVILDSELKGDKPRFGVTPISSLGMCGPTVWSK